jgi:aminoglycoside phosphotransferase (APT) family kinase protein
MSDLDEAKLGSWLRENGLATTSSTQITKFAGGQSNPTYRVETGDKSLVLRRKPFGPILASAHAVEREYRLIAALHPADFPVPRPHALCEDAEVIGAPFYVMDLVAGRTLWDGALPGMTPNERAATYHAIIDTLAALHAIDPAEVGLSDFGRPGNYFARQVERWTKQYRASQTDDLPDVERLIEWLPRTVPEQQRTSIVHGDFRIDNMIFYADRPEIRAVIDWELATLGDPLADLSYFLMSWVTAPEGRAGVKGLTGLDTGIPAMEAMAQRYCVATGRDGVPALDWYFAYNLFRLTGIVQGIKKRMLDGNASSTQAAATVAQLPGLAEAAWGFAERAGA